MPYTEFTEIEACQTPEGEIYNAHVKVLREVFNAAEDDIVAAYNADELARLRVERNKRIAETDWWANSDLTMTAEQTAYRQALRDITDNYSSLDDVVWPDQPA